MAITISRWSLSAITALFVAVTVLNGLFAAAGLLLLRPGPVDASYALRAGLASAVDPGDLLLVPGGSTAFYVWQGLASLTSLVLPILFLGSFVFKLFWRDPLKWRAAMSIEDYVNGPMLSIRFYGSTSGPLVDVTVRVFARIRSTGQPPLIINHPLRTWIDGEIMDFSNIPYSPPGLPCTVRVPLGGSLTCTEICRGSDIEILDQRLKKERVQILALASGTSLRTGTSFVSLKSYELVGDSLQLGHFKEIEADEAFPARSWTGWNSFEATGNLYIFIYGSLISATSMERTIGPPLEPGPGPFEADLAGWQRAWNVGSHPTQGSTRVLLDEQDERFTGLTAGMGIEVDPSGNCVGAVYRVSNRELSLLDTRESDYSRREVTNAVTWAGKGEHCTVYTYVPTADARERFDQALANGNIVVRRRYLEMVDEAFGELGERARARYHAEAPTPPCEIKNLIFLDTTTGARY